MELNGSYSLDQLVLGLASNLATDLVKSAAGRLKTAAWGDKEQNEFRAVWESGFTAMLRQVAADLPDEQVQLLDDIFRQFVNDPEVREAFLAMTLSELPPNYAFLEERFDSVFDRETLSVDFHKAIRALTDALQISLQTVASSHDSPLYNLVSLGRLSQIRSRITDQGETLATISESLLRLTDVMEPLSTVPRSIRPQIRVKLVGRNEEIQALTARRRDFLIVGQPGSGKTSLLSHLVSSANAYFVIDANRTKLRRTIQALPDDTILIVDDVHSNLPILRDLSHIRDELRANFHIIASTWPSYQDRVRENLNLPQDQVLVLSLLIRDEIIEIFRGMNLQGPNHLLRELADQARGRPGLAVTLALTVLRDGANEIVSGNLLARTLMESIADGSLRSDAELFLAVFSFGGDRGLPSEFITHYLNISVAELNRVLDVLSGSGLIEDTWQSNISVQPEALRHALVKRVFYDRPSPINVEDLLNSIPFMDEGLITLIKVKGRGANIEDWQLQQLLLRTNSTRAFGQYAWLGNYQASWVAQNYPGSITEIAYPLLERAPKDALPKLFQLARIDNRPENAATDHPKRLISDWVKRATPDVGDPITRRRTLLECLQNWIVDGGDISVVPSILRFVMFPGFEYNESDPGIGLTLTIHYGLLTYEQLTQLGLIWKSVSKILSEITIQDWTPVLEVAQLWAYPHMASFGRVQIPEEIESLMRNTSSTILQLIVDLAYERPGTMYRVRRIVESLGLNIIVPADPDFSILCPTYLNRNHFDEEHEIQIKAVEELAVRWRILEPKWVASRIAFFSQEVLEHPGIYPCWIPYLCQVLAKSVVNPVFWFETLTEIGATSDCAGNFLHVIVSTQVQGWELFLEKGLLEPKYRATAIWILLKLEKSPEYLIQVAYNYLPDVTAILENMAFARKIPQDTLQLLFDHPNDNVAFALAYGEWQANPDGEIRRELLPKWKHIITKRTHRLTNREYELSTIFKRDPLLGLEWLAFLVEDSQAVSYYFDFEDVIEVLSSELDGVNFADLLKKIGDKGIPAGKLLKLLIGDDVSRFSILLGDSRLKSVHLAPLAEMPTEAWVAKAQLALDHGYSETEIADASFSFPWSWSGNLSNLWSEWVKGFKELQTNKDQRIQRVGRIGERIASERRDSALEQERNEAVFGLR